MPDTSSTNRRSPIVLLLLLGAVILAAVFLFLRRGSEAPLPAPSSDRYKEMVSAFYTGTVALIVQDKDRPEPELKRATEIVPDEPAAWANLGVVYLRRPTQLQEAR